MIDRALRSLLWTTIVHHPLPWRIEEDWTMEVIASDGVIVANCSGSLEATALIKEAESMYRDVMSEET